MTIATALTAADLQMAPHGYCYLWQPNLVRLRVLSDGLTAAAYYSIPIILAIFATKRQDIPFNRVFWLFAAFIFACGTTHIMGIWTIWHPDYWAAGAIKAFTALVSVWTALSLVGIVQQALKIPKLIAVEQANRDLLAEIDERKQIEAALYTSEANFREMAASVPGAIIRYGLRPDGTDGALYVSSGCYKLCGIEAAIAEQDIGNLWALTEPEDLPAMQASIAASAQTLETWYHEWRITTPSGQLKWLQGTGNPTQQPNGDIVWGTVILDISDRKQAEEQLIYSALHDSLTDLPNRNLLSDRLNLSIQRIQQSPTYHFAVLFIDLDQFKVVNDSLGHLVGDKLLITVARKLQDIARPTDIVARLGGDDFVLLVEHVPDIQAVVQIAARIQTEAEGTTTIDGHTFFISASIGIVWGTVAYTEAADLLRDANIAMYRAKAKGRAKYEIFDAEMHTQAVKRMTLEHDLRLAIIQQQFVVHYQPIVDLNTYHLKGFEALIRWQHPTRGFISPADFIPVAEETGLIVPISRWILQAACEQMATWRQQFSHTDDLRISVNLSGSDLLQANLIDTIQQVLHQTQLPATALALEITESMLVQNIELTIELLHQLRALGIRISIDDFGTGYSSLSYLYNLPADYLKIDQSFVGNMQPGDKNYKIVQAVVSLSDQLQIGAIAEGIETEQQLAWLKDLGCELGQGYLLAQPLTPTAATDLLAMGPTLQR